MVERDADGDRTDDAPALAVSSDDAKATIATPVQTGVGRYTVDVTFTDVGSHTVIATSGSFRDSSTVAVAAAAVLASTGVDASMPFAIGIVVVLLGAVALATATVWRRRREH